MQHLLGLKGAFRDDHGRSALGAISQIEVLKRRSGKECWGYIFAFDLLAGP